MLRDTTAELKHCDPQHAWIIMDDGETMEEMLPNRDNVVLDVQCYCCVYVTQVVYSLIVPMVMCTCNICSIVYI